MEGFHSNFYLIESFGNWKLEKALSLESWGNQIVLFQDLENRGGERGWMISTQEKTCCFCFEIFSLLKLQSGKKIYHSVWIETKANVYSHSAGGYPASTLQGSTLLVLARP